MDLKFYHGVNCRLAGLINIAAMLNANYFDAFSTLWSETDFKYEEEYKLYVSKRIYPNIEAVGIMSEALISNGVKTDFNISQIPDGEFLLVGTDIFHMPWHPLYNYGHDLHYFFARKESSNAIFCSDAIYNVKNIRICPDVLSYSFELCRVYTVDIIPPKIDLKKEAYEVLSNHSALKEKMFSELRKCETDGKIQIVALTKQLRAMLNNRYLFADFLHNSAYVPDNYKSFFSKQFLARWEAVQNGLYKASIIKDNCVILDGARNLLSELIQEETAIAEKIIAGYEKTAKQLFVCSKQSL